MVRSLMGRIRKLEAIDNTGWGRISDQELEQALELTIKQELSEVERQELQAIQDKVPAIPKDHPVFQMPDKELEARIQELRRDLNAPY